MLEESTATGSINYDYDDNGNLISKSNGTNTVTYTYDAANQMVGYTNGSVTQQNVYNGKGQRIKKTEGSNVTNYFYDGSELLYTTDGTGALKALQLYDANADLFAAVYADDTMYFYTEDIKGSIVNLVDENQNAVVSYTYTDYGETTESQGGSLNNEIRFAGGVYDETTGLYYLNARFYDPAVGRFLNPDSYRGEPVDPQTLHLYAYCANNPINLVDPTGYAAETVVDVVFLGLSYAEFIAAPSAATFGFFIWDGVATVVPFVPGSYLAKGASAMKKAGIIDNLASHGFRNLVEKGFSNAAKSASNRISRKAGGNVKKISYPIKTSKITNITAEAYKKAKNIAQQIKANNGAPPKGYKGGRTYKNIPLEVGAQKLPGGVSYKEYDINPYVKGRNRGAERIVIGDDGSVWYTSDHYYTFTRIE